MPTRYNSINWLHIQITFSILYTFQLPLSFVMRSCLQTIIASIGSNPNYHLNLVYLPIAIIFCHETMPTNYNCINWLHTQITISILYTFQLPLSFVMRPCLPTICINWLHTQITISILYTFQLSLSFVMRPCLQTIIPSIGSTPKLPSQSCIPCNCHCFLSWDHAHKLQFHELAPTSVRFMMSVLVPNELQT